MSLQYLRNLERKNWRVEYKVIEIDTNKTVEVDTFVISVSIYDGLDNEYTELVDKKLEEVRERFDETKYRLCSYCLGKAK